MFPSILPNIFGSESESQSLSPSDPTFDPFSFEGTNTNRECSSSSSCVILCPTDENTVKPVGCYVPCPKETTTTTIGRLAHCEHICPIDNTIDPPPNCKVECCKDPSFYMPVNRPMEKPSLLGFLNGDSEEQELPVISSTLEQTNTNEKGKGFDGNLFYGRGNGLLESVGKGKGKGKRISQYNINNKHKMERKGKGLRNGSHHSYSGTNNDDRFDDKQ